MFQKFLSIVLLPVFLTGCELPGTNLQPTPFPAGYMPTVIYLTAESINATVSAATTPTVNPTETLTPIPPTPAPTDTLTPAPGFSLAAIQINKPGPSSKIVSPLEVQILAVAGDSNTIDVVLFGENGALLFHRIIPVPGHPTGDYVSLKILFEIRPAAGEFGFLQVSTKEKSGVIQSLSTVRVLLLSSGVSQINPAGNAIYERVTLPNLPPKADVAGGVLSLLGVYTPYNQQQVILELISDAGQLMSSRVLNVPNLNPQNFNTTLPYKVSVPTQARLFIHQEDDVLKRPAYIYSQEIMLNP